MFALIEFVGIPVASLRSWWNQNINPKSAESANFLYGILEPYIMRRTKEFQYSDGTRLVELPPVTIHQIDIEFTEDEQEIYDNYHRCCRNKIDRLLSLTDNANSKLQNFTHIFKLIGSLRQMCDSFSLVISPDDLVPGQSLMKAFEEHCQEKKHMSKHVSSTPSKIQICEHCQNVLCNTHQLPCAHEFCYCCCLYMSERDHSVCSTCLNPFDINTIVKLEDKSPSDTLRKPNMKELEAGTDEGPSFFESTIQSFKTNIYESCPICCEPPDDPAGFKCGHIFCYKCAARALQFRRACPVCRVEVRPTDLLHCTNMKFKFSKESLDIKSPLFEPGTKLKKVLRLVHNIKEKKEKVVIFVQFIGTLKIIVELLTREGIKSNSLHGGHSASKRNQALQQFQTNLDIDVFVCTMRAGSTGVNMTAANHVIIYSLWWTAALTQQAQGRVHRIGQNKPVHIYIVTTINTIEQRIKELCDAKQHISNAIIDNKSNQDSMSDSRTGVNQIRHLLASNNVDHESTRLVISNDHEVRNSLNRHDEDLHEDEDHYDDHPTIQHSATYADERDVIIVKSDSDFTDDHGNHSTRSE